MFALCVFVGGAVHGSHTKTDVMLVGAAREEAQGIFQKILEAQDRSKKISTASSGVSENNRYATPEDDHLYTKVVDNADGEVAACIKVSSPKKLWRDLYTWLTVEQISTMEGLVAQQQQFHAWMQDFNVGESSQD